MSSHRFPRLAATLIIATAATFTPLPATPAYASGPNVANVSEMRETPAGHTRSTQPAPTLTQTSDIAARRRFGRTRGTTVSNDPVSTALTLILVIIVVVALILIRRMILESMRRQSNASANYYGPNGPQYGYTGTGGYPSPNPQASVPMSALPDSRYANYDTGSAPMSGIGYQAPQPAQGTYGNRPYGTS